MNKQYDIIIVGGGTAGCACAYTAGKLGLKVLLLEKESFLGGTMTSALVTPAMNTKTTQKINTDFYEILMKKLNEIGGQITYSDGNIGWFNPELMKIVLDYMMDEAGVDTLFNTTVSEIVHDGTHINGVYITNHHTNINRTTDSKCTDNINISNKILCEYIETKYIVDSTGDAKIFEKLNLKFLDNFDKKNKKFLQPANLRFIMSGINKSELAEWLLQLDSNTDVTTVYRTDNDIHMSSAYTWDKSKNWALEPVFRSGIEEGLILDADVNYFQLFSIPGMPDSIAFNCPRTIENIDAEDKIQTSKALKTCREAIFRLSVFLKNKFKGFENSYISAIAPSLGIRVSNRIRGKYIYTIDDLRNGKTFKNPVLISKYPIDIHSSDNKKAVLETQEQEYMLPVESLISADYGNLFAIGRCISADYLAQGALRIIPSCFSMGEGLAKYLAE